MAIQFSGSISYLKLSLVGDAISLSVEGNFALTKGLMDYFATPDWQTVWRVYNEYGQLLFEDARHHSIMLFSSADTATDSFTAEFNKGGDVYTVQVYGRISGETGFMDQKSFNIYTNQPVPTPSPVPQPIIPTPVPLPTPVIPTPTRPKPSPFPSIPTITGISTGVIILAVLALFFLGRR